MINRKIGDDLDVRDTVGTWLPAHIIKIYGENVFVHYHGYLEKWDEWILKNSSRLSEKGSRVDEDKWEKLTKILSFKIGDDLDVLDSSGTWISARVIDMNDASVCIQYNDLSNEWIEKSSYRLSEKSNKPAVADTSPKTIKLRSRVVSTTN